MAKLKANETLVIAAIITGNTTLLDEDLRQIVETVRTLIDAAVGFIDDIPAKELGELHGNIAGQIVQTIVIESATAGGATPALLQKSTLLTRFVAKLNEPIELAPKLAKFNELLAARKAAYVARVVERVEELATTRMCFIAGTPVWTAGGLMTIESICPGDLVLARDEQTSELTYKPVIDTIVTHPSDLWTVTFKRVADGRSSSADDRLTGTAEHPFWVNQRAEFVPMNALRVGDTLTLAQGGTATVMDIAVERGPPNGSAQITTYNLEVADFHTYFVGHDGVWVHNSSALCEKLFSTWKWLEETYPSDNVHQRWARLEQQMNQWLLRRAGSQQDSWQHLGDAMDEVVKDVRRASGKYVPNDSIWSPGSDRNPGTNLWKRHWLKHQNEFPELAGPIEYVDKAMDFASNTTSSGSRKVAEGLSNGRRIRIVWDRAGGLNNYGVATVNPDGSLGPISTFFRLDRTYIEARTPFRDIPNGPDVFEQYLNRAVADIKGTIR